MPVPPTAAADGPDSLSPVSLGLWHNFGAESDYENARRLVHSAFDSGITYFDLANNYGPPPGYAEECFGRIFMQDLSRYRDELVIATKAGHLMWEGPYGDWGSRKHMLASLNQSLSRMKLDYVDIFYAHRHDPETPLEETAGALVTAVQSGKALYAGISEIPGGTDQADLRHAPGSPRAMPGAPAPVQYVQPGAGDRSFRRYPRGRARAAWHFPLWRRGC